MRNTEPRGIVWLMKHFSYETSPYPIPAKMAEAYRSSWQYIAEAGNWWTGAERVAIAAASRTARGCDLCRECKAALSPYAVDGVHAAAAGPLTDNVVDAVHRITTDAARLTSTWLEQCLDTDFTYGHYVEVVSIVVTTLCIDSFNEALGLELEPLPEPVPGTPSRYLPPGAAVDVAWVPMVRPETLTEPEADIFAGAPHAPNVIRALSLVPDAVRQLYAQSAVQYLDFSSPSMGNFDNTGDLRISRPQIELIASRTSSINDCFY